MIQGCFKTDIIEVLLVYYIFQFGVFSPLTKLPHEIPEITAQVSTQYQLSKEVLDKSPFVWGKVELKYTSCTFQESHLHWNRWTSVNATELGEYFKLPTTKHLKPSFLSTHTPALVENTRKARFVIGLVLRLVLVLPTSLMFVFLHVLARTKCIFVVNAWSKSQLCPNRLYLSQMCQD